jgi:hypothetical protein
MDYADIFGAFSLIHIPHFWRGKTKKTEIEAVHGARASCKLNKNCFWVFSQKNYIL